MTTYHHLFGPVPSRRSGISLGIDLIPMKTSALEDSTKRIGLQNN